MTNIMEKVIAELEWQRARITEALESLYKLGSSVLLNGATAAPVTSAEKTKSLRDKIKESKGLERKRVPAGGSNKRERSASNLAIVGALAQPFTAKDVAEACGVVNGNSTIKRWVAEGALRRLEHGRYERTEKWPATNGQERSQAVPAPEPTPAAPKAATDLETALKRRDEANARGDVQIAKYYQREINRLSK